MHIGIYRYMRPLTTTDASERLGTNHATILDYINSGELRAVNTSQTERPRWKILNKDFDSFCEKRSNRHKIAAKRVDQAVTKTKQRIAKQYV